MRRLSVFLIVIFLLSSCTAAEISSSATPTADFTKTRTPISTETPLPTAMATAMATATLMPITIECIIEDNVSTEKDCQLIKDSIRMARYYLLNNFGKDASGNLAIKFYTGGKKPHQGFADYYGEGKNFSLDYKDLDHITININTNHQYWADYNSDESLYNKVIVGLHEFTHFWQLKNGCLLPYSNADYLNQGHASYVAFMAIGKPELMNSGQGVIVWPYTKFRIDEWINRNDVAVIQFRDLMEQYPPLKYAEYCTLQQQGLQTDDAFLKAFGISKSEFETQFIDRTLGSLKNCTIDTCGKIENPSEVYKISDMLDPNISEPNLIINFTDESGQPAKNTIFTICDKNDCTGGEDKPIEDGQFIRSMKLGTYEIYLCEPGYEENSGNPIKCVFELKPFDITAGKVTTIDFQFKPILNPEGAVPNFDFTLQTSDGVIAPNAYIQICSDEPVSRHCLNTKTDENGKFTGSFLPGKYMVRLVMPGQGFMDQRGVSNPEKYGRQLSNDTSEYEIKDISISGAEITKLTYSFPAPNLIIHFNNAYGSAILPDLMFWLCRSDASNATSNLEAYTLLKDKELTDYGLDCFKVFQADKNGTFQTRIGSGTYSILFNAAHPRWTFPLEYEMANIQITSRTELTEITFQPK